MHWYEGSIAEAVNLSKQRNAIFVVFIEGDNDLSIEMASTIDDVDVLKRLADPDNFLAIKLKSGSTSYTHFAQIYQFVPVPSLFFIGRNGTPLEVVCAGVQPANLAIRIDRILEEHQKEKPATVKPSTSGEQIKQQTAELLHAEGAPPEQAPGKREAEPETSSGAKVQKTHHEITKSGREYDVVCDGDVCVRVSKPSDPGPSSAPHTASGEKPLPTPSSSPSPTPAPAKAASPDPAPATPSAPPAETDSQDKIERAKELIEARRREKAAQEKELEKQKELERRNLGQGVTELKKWQAEQDLKQIQEERKREKMENNLARQRILEQIAQDRAERRARDAPPPPPPVAPPAAPAAAHPNVGDATSRARIQFKLPDGTSHTAHFDAGGTLGDVQQYVADNLQLPTTGFSLWTAFPRRELTDAAASLRRLQLTPSAALLVLPRRAVATPPAPPGPLAAVFAFISQLFTTLFFEPSQQLLGWFRNRLFPAVAPRDPAPAPDAPGAPSGAPPNVNPGAAAFPTQNIGLRRRGNIHRLGNERPEEDDNNTWNGNSTQQM